MSEIESAVSRRKKVGLFFYSDRLYGTAQYSVLLLYVLVMLVHGGYFSALNATGGDFVGVAAFAGILLGLASIFFERFVACIANRITGRLGKALSAFFFFFLYLVGYTIVFSLLVSYPLGSFLEYQGAQEVLLRGYSLYSMNWILFLSTINWFIWLRKFMREQLPLCP